MTKANEPSALVIPALDERVKSADGGDATEAELERELASIIGSDDDAGDDDGALNPVPDDAVTATEGEDEFVD